MAKRTNIDIQNTIQKTKERATQVLQIWNSGFKTCLMVLSPLTMGATSGAGTAYSSGAPELHVL
jgi:hypothetical protein